jgi:hypothetical protein
MLWSLANFCDILLDNNTLSLASAFHADIARSYLRPIRYMDMATTMQYALGGVLHDAKRLKKWTDSFHSQSEYQLKYMHIFLIITSALGLPQNFRLSNSFPCSLFPRDDMFCKNIHSFYNYLCNDTRVNDWWRQTSQKQSANVKCGGCRGA